MPNIRGSYDNLEQCRLRCLGRSDCAGFVYATIFNLSCVLKSITCTDSELRLTGGIYSYDKGESMKKKKSHILVKI